MQQQIVVTGSTGYIGSALVSRLGELGHAVHLTRISSESNYANRFWLMHLCDTVVHLAANTIGDWQTNVEGTTQLVGCIPSGCRFVFASSLTAANPQDNYDREKKIGEIVAQVRPDITTIVLRLGRVYGPPVQTNQRSILNRLIMQAAHGESISLYGQAYAARDYVYLDDVVQAFVVALDLGTPAGVYDVGTGRSISQLEAAQILARLSGVCWYVDDCATDGASFVAIRSHWLPGWRPEIQLEEGLSRTLAWVRVHAQQNKKELVCV